MFALELALLAAVESTGQLWMGRPLWRVLALPAIVVIALLANP